MVTQNWVSYQLGVVFVFLSLSIIFALLLQQAINIIIGQGLSVVRMCKIAIIIVILLDPKLKKRYLLCDTIVFKINIMHI